LLLKTALVENEQAVDSRKELELVGHKDASFALEELQDALIKKMLSNMRIDGA